jgi:AAA+ ATPase superfamily predicted ATPase
LGGYLDRLENDFGRISKIRPVLSKPAGKAVKYRINDNFLNFWFRFIYKYRGAVEMENFDYVKNRINRDYNTYSGQILERYFRAKISTEENLSQIGSYWETGNQNEIDIVAINEYERTAIIAEVKRQAKHIDLDILRKKAEHLVAGLNGYTIDFRGLSMEDM